MMGQDAAELREVLPRQTGEDEGRQRKSSRFCSLSCTSPWGPQGGKRRMGQGHCPSRGRPLSKKASPSAPGQVGKPYNREMSSLGARCSQSNCQKRHHHPLPRCSNSLEANISELISPKFSQYLADSENRGIPASVMHDHKLIISQMS